jgi:hypothetical protein
VGFTRQCFLSDLGARESYKPCVFSAAFRCLGVEGMLWRRRVCYTRRHRWWLSQKTESSLSSPVFDLVVGFSDSLHCACTNSVIGFCPVCVTDSLFK